MKNDTKYLTSLRGIACLMVVCIHFISVKPEIGVYFVGCGKIGVWLFFILSALLLTLQGINEENINLKNTIIFYIKRFFRIYPSYIIIFIIIYLIRYIADIKTIILHLLLQEGQGHFWTIPVEFKFYLIIPLLVFILKKFKNDKIKLLFLFGLFLLTTFTFPYTIYEGNSITLAWYWPVFLTGMILAYIFKYYEKNPRESIIFDVVFFIDILCIILSTPYFRKLFFGLEPEYYLSNKYIYFGIAWSILIISIQNSRYIKKYLNNSKILLAVGNISFPLYLVHYIVLQYIFTIASNINSLKLKLLIVIIISIMISILIHLLIEKPSIKLSKTIINKISNIKEKKEGDKNGKV